MSPQKRKADDVKSEIIEIIDETPPKKKKKNKKIDTVSSVVGAPVKIAQISTFVENAQEMQTYFKNFIIYNTNDNPVNVIYVSTSKNRMNLTIDKHSVSINGHLLGTGETKLDACTQALEILQKYCYTIQVKSKFYSNVETIKPDGNIETVGKSLDPSEQRIESNNIGFKLLKSLGWSGGSLGATNSGILDPIKAEIRIGRQGLGHGTDDAVDIRRIRKMLIDFKHSNDLCDLVFSPEFTREERTSVHQAAIKLGLKTKSYGKNEDNTRHVVISRYKNIFELFDMLMRTNDAGLKQKYEVIPPKLLG